MDRTAAGAFVCKLGKDHGKPVRATAKEVEEGTAETVAYPIQHPKVKKLVQQALAGL